MIERALAKTIAHIVPPPAKEATFKWIIEHPGGTFRGKVYTDGSRLDGPSQLLARNGWAFVVIDDDGVVMAAASGAPPDWIDDIPGTESWALAQAGMCAEPGCTFYVDCEPCVNAFHVGQAIACADNRPLARVHLFMHSILDDVPPEAVIWMPSHGKGTVRGDGFLVTETDIKGNALADEYTKIEPSPPTGSLTT